MGYAFCVVLSCLTPSLVTDAVSPSQWSLLATQNIDLDCTSESQGTSPPAVPGCLPMPTIREDTNGHKVSLITEHGDSAFTTLRDLGDSAPLNRGHNAEYLPFSLIKGCEAYLHALGSSYYHLIRLKTHPQASGQAFASLLMWSVADLCPLSSSREQTSA